jgi:hypothetical protein
VADWLNETQFGTYVAAAKKSGVTGRMLMTMTSKTIEKDLGIKACV